MVRSNMWRSEHVACYVDESGIVQTVPRVDYVKIIVDTRTGEVTTW